jgi:hypothetical protein
MMNCYFMKDGRISSVELLIREADDDVVREATELFESRGQQRKADGFEVWAGARFVYRHASEETKSLVDRLCPPPRG